jgi:hypothetical protein
MWKLPWSQRRSRQKQRMVILLVRDVLRKLGGEEDMLRIGR